MQHICSTCFFRWSIKGKQTSELKPSESSVLPGFDNIFISLLFKLHNNIYFHYFKDTLIEKSVEFVKNGADHQRTHLNGSSAFITILKKRPWGWSDWLAVSRFQASVESLAPNTLRDFNFLTSPMTTSPVISTLWEGAKNCENP